jgi:hypothetical protein
MAGSLNKCLFLKKLTMNKSARRSEGTVPVFYKERTFRKLSEILDTLIALDFRGSGLKLFNDTDSLSIDLSVMKTAYTKRSLTFQIVPDGSIMILGHGFSDNHAQVNVMQLSKVISQFLKDHKPVVN